MESEDETAGERTTRVGRPRGGMKVAARIGEKLRRDGVQQSHRVDPRASSCPVPFSHIHKLTLASLKRCLNPESSDFRLGRCAPSTSGDTGEDRSRCISLITERVQG